MNFEIRRKKTRDYEFILIFLTKKYVKFLRSGKYRGVLR